MAPGPDRRALRTTVPRSIDQFCRDMVALAERGGRSEALDQIRDLVSFVIGSADSLATVFGSPQLDALCQSLGRTRFQTDWYDPDHAVFLVTTLSRTGGHSRVLRDLVAADPARRKTVIVSNVHDSADEAELAGAALAGCDIRVAPAAASLDDALQWIQAHLSVLRPERTYILPHHSDCLLAAAVQPGLVRRLFYIHNCDHGLALGVHLPHATHVDLHAKGFHNCREREGVAGNVYWPLVATSVEPRSPPHAPAPLATCTSGGKEKFASSHLREKLPYLLEYADMVPVILAATGGLHHHIGPLDPELLGRIRQRLQDRGIDPASFVQTDYAPTLAGYFRANAIDLYLGSMPWGGGRALVEAMAAGLPVAIHANYQSAFFTDQSEAYPGAKLWRTFDELDRLLRNLDRDDLEAGSRAALNFFQAHHRPEALADAIAETLRGGKPEPPARPVFHPDALQTFLDQRAAWDGQVRVDGAALETMMAGIRDLERAYRRAEALAVERLGEIRSLERRLAEAERAPGVHPKIDA